MLHGKRGIDVMLIVFDVLAVEGRDVPRRSYWEHRRLLEDLKLDGPAWAASPVYEDGEALRERSAGSAWKASSPRSATATTCPAAAAGSRPRTAPTGGNGEQQHADRHGQAHALGGAAKALTVVTEEGTSPESSAAGTQHACTAVDHTDMRIGVIIRASAALLATGVLDLATYVDFRVADRYTLTATVHRRDVRRQPGRRR